MQKVKIIDLLGKKHVFKDKKYVTTLIDPEEIYHQGRGKISAFLDVAIPVALGILIAMIVGYYIV